MNHYSRFVYHFMNHDSRSVYHFMNQYSRFVYHFTNHDSRFIHSLPAERLEEVPGPGALRARDAHRVVLGVLPGGLAGAAQVVVRAHATFVAGSRNLPPAAVARHAGVDLALRVVGEPGVLQWD